MQNVSSEDSVGYCLTKGYLSGATEMNKKVTHRRIVLASVIIAFALSVIILRTASFLDMPVRAVVTALHSNKMRERLLCRTDHEALLEACREVLRRGDLQIGRHYLVRGARRRREVSSLPQPILDLAPSSIGIEKMGGLVVRLEMAGTVDHFGVHAYPEDYEPPREGFRYGDKQLVPGLWYYDDGCADPEYDAKIDALLKKRKQAH